MRADLLTSLVSTPRAARFLFAGGAAGCSGPGATQTLRSPERCGLRQRPHETLTQCSSKSHRILTCPDSGAWGSMTPRMERIAPPPGANRSTPPGANRPTCNSAAPVPPAGFGGDGARHRGSQARFVPALTRFVTLTVFSCPLLGSGYAFLDITERVPPHALCDPRDPATDKDVCHVFDSPEPS